jgi:signal transduction histidine kinase
MKTDTALHLDAAPVLTAAQLCSLETLADPVLDGLVRSAESIVDCGAGRVRPGSRQRQWFRAQARLDLLGSLRESPFCAHAAQGPGVFEVGNAADDPRFAQHVLVAGGPRLCAYAGAPLVVKGRPIGTLCVMELRPLRLDAAQRRLLTDLARAIEHWIGHWLDQQTRQLEHLRHESHARAKGDALASASHTMRTLLQSVLGFTHLALADPSLAPRTQAHLQHARRGGEQILALANDVMERSRIEQDLGPLRCEPVLVDGAVAAGVAQMAPVTLQRRLRVMTQGTQHGIWALADARALNQVLLNLLSNAVTYNRTDGGVWVEVRQRSHEVCISVTDEGPGLTPVQRACLFQAQGHPARHGRGLVISQRLVQAQQGRLEVHDGAAGHGCRFEVWLPAATGRSAPAADPQTTPVADTENV